MNTVTKDKKSILEDLIHRADELSVKVRELKEAESELEQINQAIKVLGGRTTNLLHNVVDLIIAELSWPEKVKRAVGNLGQASVPEIITEVVRLDPELRKKESTTIHNNVTSVASGLAAKGELIAYKDGVRNIYSLPKK
jgi:hypothetical protein